MRDSGICRSNPGRQRWSERLTYSRFPAAHHHRIRTTNQLERLNGKGRRRTKVIPHFPAEQSCLTLLLCHQCRSDFDTRGCLAYGLAQRQR